MKQTAGFTIAIAESASQEKTKKDSAFFTGNRMDDSAQQQESRRLERLSSLYEAGYLSLGSRLDSRADSKIAKKALVYRVLNGTGSSLQKVQEGSSRYLEEYGASLQIYCWFHGCSCQVAFPEILHAHALETGDPPADHIADAPVHIY